jgi:type II secretory pathway pseudopilin PulG
MLELVIVMVVVGVVAAVAAPRMASARARYRALGAASQVASDITRARELAMASSAGVEVRFRADSSRYAVVALQPGGAGGYQSDLASPPWQAWVHSANFGGLQTLTISGAGVVTSGLIVVRTEKLASTISVGPTGAGTPGEPAAIAYKKRVDDAMNVVEIN